MVDYDWEEYWSELLTRSRPWKLPSAPKTKMAKRRKTKVTEKMTRKIQNLGDQMATFVIIVTERDTVLQNVLVALLAKRPNERILKRWPPIYTWTPENKHHNFTISRKPPLLRHLSQLLRAIPMMGWALITILRNLRFIQNFTHLILCRGTTKYSMSTENKKNKNY